MNRWIAIIFVCVGTIAASPCGHVLAQGRSSSSGSEAGVTTVSPDGQGTAFTDSLDAGAEQPFRLRPFVVRKSLVVLVGSRTMLLSEYRLNERHGHLWIDALPSDSVSIVVSYDTLPIQLQDVYRNEYVKPYEAPDSTGYFATIPGEAAPPLEPEGFFGGSGLSRSGSISRGVIAGNNRDVTIESGLRMQLSGEVVEGVNIRAALTDENTPILPEGTTQRIQELDKVFIEISTKSAVATLGDFQLDLKESRFGQFSRKLQGVSIAGEVPGLTSGVFGGANLTASGATTRGIFRSQQIGILEGVQGPYRLEGQFGERFIILVPGSEVVYLDGIALTRGETNDYVIDYATAEITFTANRIIGADRRVAVEFQYSTNQFTRTLVAAEGKTHFWKKPGADFARGEFGVAVIREADSRQFTEEFGLTTSDSLLLAQAGDEIASRSGAVLVDYDPEAPFVQYVREPVEGQFDTVFVAITSPPADSVDVFRVQFSRLGPGLGDYIRVGRLVNGIQYEYAGLGLGEYAPIRLLPRPKRQQLVNFFGKVTPIKGVEIAGELAQSQNDLNRLSAVDSNDDGGSAYTGSITILPLKIGRGDRSFGSVSAAVSRIRRGANFTSFNRTRAVEFGRAWNLESSGANPLGSVVPGSSDEITEGNLRYELPTGSFVQAGFGALDVGSTIRSERFSIESEVASSSILDAAYRLEQISSTSFVTLEDGTWFRQRGRLQRNIMGFVPSVEVEHERRRQTTANADSLLATSFEFVEFRPGVRKESEKYSAGGTVEFRQDSYPLQGLLKDGGNSWTVQSNASIRPSQIFDTEVVLGYRNVSVKEPFQQSLQKEDRKSVVLRLSGNARPLKRAVRASWTYDARTERTPKLQEIYIRTGPELGQYVWVDANEDNVVQVDEFVQETTPNEGNYVRSFVPSDSLFSIVGVESRFRVDLDPSKLLKGDSGTLSSVLRSVSTRSVITINEKNSTDRLRDIYLLKLKRFRDEELTLAGRLAIRQDVYLFKNQRKYGGEVSFNQIRSLNNLATGLETKFINRWQTIWNTRPNDTVLARLTAVRSIDRAANTSFASRNFNIRTLEMSPEVTYSPVRSTSLTLSPSYATKNDEVGNRRSTLIKIPLEVRLSRPSQYQIFSIFEVANVDLTGDAQGQAGFELTDGRGPGRSYLWSVNGQYSINQYLRAVLSYDGRVPSSGRTIHTMRMQLSAVF